MPVAAALANRHPDSAVFTRFSPPERPDHMPGMWRRYCTRWRVPTRERLDLQRLELMTPAAGGALPAGKTRYSAFAEPRPIEQLRQRETDALIVSGSETDVCVLATVLDAVDASSSCATPYAARLTKGTTC